MSEVAADKPPGINYWAFIGVIIAISPAIGYLLAFCYEQEYFWYFKIPSELMIIDWTKLLLGMVSFLSVSSVLFIIIVLPDIIMNSWFKTNGVIAKHLIWVGSLLIFATIICLRYFVSDPKIWLFYVLPLFFLIRYFIFPLFSQKKINGYEAKLLEQDKIGTAKYNINNPEGIKKYQTLILYSLMLLVIIFIVAMLQGLKDATTRKDFLVFSDSPNIVVLNTTQNQFICVELNPDKVSYDEVFTILPLLKDSGTTIQLSSIGPLKPQKP